ncbi:MAG: MBL fold metallo-hydrolase [Saprospirales bacterium]|nr:MBL fold metallo-hydrolase [Saprospirales bacterium]
MKHFFFLISAVLVFSGCGRQMAKRLVDDEAIQVSDSEIRLGESFRDSLSIRYLGCGGLYIRKGDQAFLVDPFFSNQGPLLCLPFKKLRHERELIKGFFHEEFHSARDWDGIIKAVLVGHSHYDHIYDVPYIYKKHLHRDSAIIVGSRDAELLLESAGIQPGWKGGPVRDVSELARSLWKEDRFITTENRRIRILPTLGSHAPHFAGKKGLPVKEPRKWGRHGYPHNVMKYWEGDNFTFLVDFMSEDGTINFRMFIQSGAASTYPVGYPAEEVLAEKQVDLAFFCVASFDKIKRYPFEQIERMQPRGIVLVHWENFFRPQKKLMEKPRTVPFTPVCKFVKKLKRMNGGLRMPIPWVMPNVGVEVEVYY